MLHRRRNFPDAVKRDRYDHCKDENGIARCENCTTPLGATVHYEFDHDQPDAMLGDPTFENCRVLCKTCHALKTKTDRKIIAKSNHVRDRARGIKKTVFRPLPGTKASGISKPFAREPFWRDSGRPLRGGR